MFRIFFNNYLLSYSWINGTKKLHNPFYLFIRLTNQNFLLPDLPLAKKIRIKLKNYQDPHKENWILSPDFVFRTLGRSFMRLILLKPGIASMELVSGIGSVLKLNIWTLDRGYLNPPPGIFIL